MSQNEFCNLSGVLVLYPGADVRMQREVWSKILKILCRKQRMSLVTVERADLTRITCEPVHNSPLYGSSSLMDSSKSRDVSNVLKHKGKTGQPAESPLPFQPDDMSHSPAASNVPDGVSSPSQDQQRNFKTLYKLHTLSETQCIKHNSMTEMTCAVMRILS